jgi:hypothetical protein
MSKEALTKQLCLLLIFASLTGCMGDEYNTNPQELREAQSICDMHGGLVRLNTPKPLDVYCSDGLHVRTYGHEK